MTAQRHVNHNLRKRCDCPRRAWPKCSHGWWFNYKPRGGTSYRISLDKHAGKHLDRKAAAEDVAAEIRLAILAGTYGQAAPRSEMTLRQLADLYLDRYVAVEHAETAQAYIWGLATICTTTLPTPTGGELAFGDWCLDDIVTDTIERFREVRRGQGTGPVGVNRHLGTLRALWNWSMRVGYTERSPFKRGSEPIVKLSEELPRSRRLLAGEEGPLLAACADHLRGVVEAALETGMRLGEILSLQWREVVGLTVENTTMAWAPRSEIVLLAAKTKTKRDRRIPISSRLKGILEMRRFDPAGEPHAPDAHVFGNAIGEPVESVKRAWSGAVLRSHGHSPKYTATGQLDEASRATLHDIDLHLHDLRRECGSRWVENNVPLHIVRDWLGHSNISQTSTYLAGTMTTQHDAMAAFEARRATVAAPDQPVQRCATDVKTTGQKREPATRRHEETPNKTGIGRQAPLM